MTFENLPTTPRAEELIDKAFSRAARAGRAKTGIEAQESMLQTAANILSDNLGNVVTSWPDFDETDPFYRDLADAILAPSKDVGGVDDIRQRLSEVMWASRQCEKIKTEYHGKIRNADSPDLARKHRKQAFARLASVVEEVAEDLLVIGAARDELKTLPDIRPDEPTIVVAGYPNVGKSSFVNHVTRASNEVASYPFTTTQIRVGHVEHRHIRYQVVDTPGLLDRPAEERNPIEKQAVSALTHLGDVVLVLVDSSESCGYMLEDQLDLRDDIAEQFPVPVMTVANKSDRSTDVDADYYMSITEDEGVNEALQAAIDAIGYEPELPYDG
jgi:nucleolar GTP-binding protein